MAAGAAGDRAEDLPTRAHQDRVAHRRGVDAELVGLLASMALAVLAHCADELSRLPVALNQTVQDVFGRERGCSMSGSHGLYGPRRDIW
jgi:hypothetical protein